MTWNNLPNFSPLKDLPTHQSLCHPSSSSMETPCLAQTCPLTPIPGGSAPTVQPQRASDFLIHPQASV